MDGNHQALSVRRQCRHLALHRSTYYDEPVGDSQENLALMRRIDKMFMDLPFLGSRKMHDMLRDDGMLFGRGACAG